MEEHLTLVVFNVPRSPDSSWSAMFQHLEHARSLLDLEEYSVSQSTLESVFIDLTTGNAST